MAGKLVVVAACTWLVITSTAVHADNSWMQNERVWKRGDDCARAVAKQYPDHTPESNANRDRAFRQCLAANNVPGRSTIDPQPVSPADQRAR
jgi:hypothetical protein